MLTGACGVMVWGARGMGWRGWHGVLGGRVLGDCLPRPWVVVPRCEGCGVMWLGLGSLVPLGVPRVLLRRPWCRVLLRVTVLLLGVVLFPKNGLPTRALPPVGRDPFGVVSLGGGWLRLMGWRCLLRGGGVEGRLAVTA